MIDDDDRPSLDAIAVVQQNPSRHRLVIHHRAVLAAKIFDARVIQRDEDARVAPRDTGGIELHCRCWNATDDVLALSQRDSASAGHDPPTDACNVRYRSLKFADKSVADAVRCANQRLC